MKGVAPVSKSDPDQDVMSNLLDQYLETSQCHRGEIVEGVIASVSSKAILIDIGGKCDATVHPREVERMDNQALCALKPGQPIKVYVLDGGDDNGTVMVSLARAVQQKDWDVAHQLMKDEETVDLPVVDVNKGGVIVRLGRLRGFVPGSQLLPTWRPRQSVKNPDRRWESLMEETLTLKVIEVTPERNRLILSEREATNTKSLKRKILKQLSVGSVEKGIVSNVVPFGAFVNVKGVDGLLHISELSWKRVNDTSEILKPGQEINVYILDVDLDQERLGLSLKRLKTDPWDGIEEEYREGQQLNVEIVNLTAFGAFAAIKEKPGIEGLIHISELSDPPASRPEEVVSVGEQHLVRIISLRPQDRRVAFSLKQVRVDENLESN